jgi:hypothetical protein
MTMLGGIQGSFVDVSRQHQYNPAQHQFELNMALQAKAAAENELILLKNQMTMMPMNNDGFFQRQGQSMHTFGHMMTQPGQQYVQNPQQRVQQFMQPLGWIMTQPGQQYAQHPQQRGPQFMQPLGGISQPGQHVPGAMNDLRCL